MDADGVFVATVEDGSVFAPDELGGELEQLEFDELLLVDDVVDAAADAAEFAARSRPPVFCCCSRCNLEFRWGRNG